MFARGACAVLDLRNNDPRLEKRLFFGGSAADVDARCSFFNVFVFASEVSLALVTPIFEKLPPDDGRLALALAFE